MRKAILLLAALLAVPASAQLPGLRRRAPAPQVPVQNPIDVLRAELAAQSGGTTIYFAAGRAQLTAQAKLQLQAQAAWLRQHPEVAVRIEGHGDPADTRDQALALGAQRAAEARNFLILLGTPAAQVSAITWGKERPGPPSAVTTIVPPSGGAALVPAGA
ncbi:MAG: OmpA family protein [Sphingomonas sp.]|nr:OmpA family protein [Sphingomonas sp.]